MQVVGNLLMHCQNYRNFIRGLIKLYIAKIKDMVDISV